MRSMAAIRPAAVAIHASTAAARNAVPDWGCLRWTEPCSINAARAWPRFDSHRSWVTIGVALAPISKEAGLPHRPAVRSVWCRGGPAGRHDRRGRRFADDAAAGAGV